MTKLHVNMEAALAPVRDGDSVMIGGFGSAGDPVRLRECLSRRRLEQLTLIANNADFAEFAYANGIAKIICSYPTGPTAAVVREAVERGEIELEVNPQGTLAERIRAGGAGLGGVLTPTGVGTDFGAQHEVVEQDGRSYLIVPALRAHVALVRGHIADTRGNVVCRRAARNFNPLMAMAANYTVVQVDSVVAPGDIDPDHVHIPGTVIDAITTTETET